MSTSTSSKARSIRQAPSYDCRLPAGEPWLHEVSKGQMFRILDLEGNQAVDTLFYNAARSRGALQRRGHHPRAGQHLPDHRLAAAVERRPA